MSKLHTYYLTFPDQRYRMNVREDDRLMVRNLLALVSKLNLVKIWHYNSLQLRNNKKRHHPIIHTWIQE